MSIQVEHLPQDEPATRDEQWPFSMGSFLEEHWLYLLAIVLLLVVFFYARYSWRKRNKR